MGRETSARQTQARALLCVAYETLARRGELVVLELSHIEFWPNGTGQALIRWGKTDAEGQGRAAYLSRETVWIGMQARFVAEVSGHSIRVGVAKDIAELDIDLAASTQAGGWKSPRMPLQYAETINAARSGMARAAPASGRDEPVPEAG
jgi:hypothetical protein